MQHIGRTLLVAGLVLMMTGLVFMAMGKMSWPGRLPGDIVVKNGDFTFYLPVATSVVLSLVLTVMFSIFSKR
ncbi:MAG: DUF2905 domain-containing protein [Candidatus Omnitrophica bacterium]|nr:DUF2905 domain-containing protein [Candidatus Omnitrophota bacterium]MDD5488910.1 DUF2905 domain-containing protein [Candidatus Omnitrophota bacterium]